MDPVLEEVRRLFSGEDQPAGAVSNTKQLWPKPPEPVGDMEVGEPQHHPHPPLQTPATAASIQVNYANSPELLPGNNDSDAQAELGVSHDSAAQPGKPANRWKYLVWSLLLWEHTSWPARFPTEC